MDNIISSQIRLTLSLLLISLSPTCSSSHRTLRVAQMDNNIASLRVVPFLFLFVALGLICPPSQTITKANANSTKPSGPRIHGGERIASAYLHLQQINKPPVKSIESPDGDIIDCVIRDKQHGLEHPLLANHKIQEPPDSLIPQLLKQSMNEMKKGSYTSSRITQLWQVRGEACPVGTIPVRRTFLKDVLRSTESPMSYGKTKNTKRRMTKKKNASVDPIQTMPTSARYWPQSSPQHEHAIAYVSGNEYYGAKAIVSVWAPKVEITSSEFSLSQMWLLGGSPSNDLNSIEVGWQVSPELYGDGRPRLFVYWTSDSYRETGCYNLLCSGFIQTSNSIALGAAIAPTSVYRGSQYQIEILVWKDPRKGNWWMVFDGHIIVGYWPSSLFTHLRYHANMVEWGGEVVNTRPNGGHTTTQMGSGRFAREGYRSASFFHGLQVVDASNNLRPVNSIVTIAEHPNCYDIKIKQDVNWGLMFFYGGPGRNHLCP